MTRRFAAITVGLTLTVGAMIGLVLAGNLTPAPATSAPKARISPTPAAAAPPPAASAAPFADVAERLNPSVVTIDATTRGTGRYRRDTALQGLDPDAPGRPLDRDRDGPRRGAFRPAR